MMSRRALPAAARLVHRRAGSLLLACALLFSQQAALLHTVSHLLQASRASAEAVEKPAKALFKEQSCADCLSYAQFFSALGSTHGAFGADKAVALQQVLPATADACIVTERLFQPRAPPPA